MADIERTALVAYRCEQMFALVNDVARYPEYMPGCLAVEIIDQSPTQLSARLTLGKAGIKQVFATRNRLEPPHLMDMVLIDGPFEDFTGRWHFQPLGELGCKVTFSLRFRMTSRLLEATVGKLMESSASEQVDALCQRAELIYGA